MTRILIIEDEERIASFISKGLRAAEYEPFVVGSAREAQIALGAGSFDLVLLDIGLPDQDGLTLLKQLRSEGVTLPVIVLTARTSIDDTVASLEGGADDYMAKPFRVEELLARIKLRVRDSNDQTVDSASQFTNGPLRIELLTRRFFIGDKSIELSAREFELAETFMRNVDIVLTREQLLSRVWGYDFDPSSNVVDVYVRYLRAKVGAQWFLTVRGVGYRMPRA
jgi:DNA-binding response OmpR family regulator